MSISQVRLVCGYYCPNHKYAKINCSLCTIQAKSNLIVPNIASDDRQVEALERGEISRVALHGIALAHVTSLVRHYSRQDSSGCHGRVRANSETGVFKIQTHVRPNGS
jgi:hypothetical protein